MIERIGAIVQARMSSKRLPGKVLRNILGKPLLGYVLDRVERSEHISEVIVATSMESEDDSVAQYCRERKTAVYRGELADVASRFVEISEGYSLDAFVRICADSPLLDQNIINRAFEIYFDSRPDIVTNVAKRSYPKGQSVEVLRAETFCQSYRAMVSPVEKEHVTSYFYKYENDFNIINFKYEDDLSHVQLSVDTEEDLESIQNIISQMSQPHWNYKLGDILKFFPTRYDHLSRS